MGTNNESGAWVGFVRATLDGAPVWGVLDVHGDVNVGDARVRPLERFGEVERVPVDEVPEETRARLGGAYVLALAEVGDPRRFVTYDSLPGEVEDAVAILDANRDDAGLRAWLCVAKPGDGYGFDDCRCVGPS